MRAGTCVHFNGIQHKCCDAGIAYDSVRVEEPRRAWPCLPPFLPRAERPSNCARYQEPTADEIAAWNARLDARLAEMDANTKAGLCDTCKAKISSVRQVGHCVYATPCGYRIGQGDAKQVAKSLGVEVW